MQKEIEEKAKLQEQVYEKIAKAMEDFSKEKDLVAVDPGKTEVKWRRNYLSRSSLRNWKRRADCITNSIAI